MSLTDDLDPRERAGSWEKLDLRAHAVNKAKKGLEESKAHREPSAALPVNAAPKDLRVLPALRGPRDTKGQQVMWDVARRGCQAPREKTETRAPRDQPDLKEIWDLPETWGPWDSA